MSQRYDTKEGSQVFARAVLNVSPDAREWILRTFRSRKNVNEMRLRLCRVQRTVNPHAAEILAQLKLQELIK